jgi:uncharacterized protein
MIIGIISDTHGVLKEQALKALKGVDHILHAGDVGGPEIVAALQKVAPVTAVRGNTDRDEWGKALPFDQMITMDGHTFYVLHDLNDLDLSPGAAGIQVVISGHTHQPVIRKEGSVLYMNPGSASQRRRGGPLSLGRIQTAAHGIQPEIIELIT